jgi:hypothetical protein
MLAALALDKGVIASRVIEGSFTQATFLEYLRDDLVSFLLSIHQTSSTDSTIQAASHKSLP